jgi:hypothetical protein
MLSQEGGLAPASGGGGQARRRFQSETDQTKIHQGFTQNQNWERSDQPKAQLTKNSCLSRSNPNLSK